MQAAPLLGGLFFLTPQKLLVVNELIKLIKSMPWWLRVLAVLFAVGLGVTLLEEVGIMEKSGTTPTNAEPKPKEPELTPQEKEPEARKELVQKQFSGWDGSHHGLTKLIKAGMNDPGSYEHIETRFEDRTTHIFVATKFRGKNAFGGKVVNTVAAKVDTKGNVLEIVSQE